MPMEDGLSDQAREYLNLQCNEEMKHLKRCIDAGRWTTKGAAIKHDRFMRKCGIEGLLSKKLLATNIGLEAGTKNLEGVDDGAPLPYMPFLTLQEISEFLSFHVFFITVSSEFLCNPI